MSSISKQRIIMDIKSELIEVKKELEKDVLNKVRIIKEKIFI